jgi:hypothetical protein
MVAKLHQEEVYGEGAIVRVCSGYKQSSAYSENASAVLKPCEGHLARDIIVHGARLDVSHAVSRHFFYAKQYITGTPGRMIVELYTRRTKSVR